MGNSEVVNCIKSGEFEEFKTLIQGEEKKNKLSTKNINKIFKKCCKKNRLKFIEFLFEKFEEKIDINNGSPTVLYECIESKKTQKEKEELVKLLLQHPEINVNKGTCIEIYSKNSGITKEKSPLYICIDKVDNLKIIEMLLNHPTIEANTGWNKYMYYTPPLYKCVKINSNEKIVKLLINHPKVNVNSKNLSSTGNETPLHKACVDSNLPMVKLLIAHPKINVNHFFQKLTEIHDYFSTPLFTCCKNSSIQTAKLLLNHPNIDVNSGFQSLNSNKEEVEETPLYIVCKMKNKILVKMLMRNENICVKQKNFKKNDIVKSYLKKIGISIQKKSPIKEEKSISDIKQKITTKNQQKKDEEIAKVSAPTIEKDTTDITENIKTLIVFSSELNVKKRIKCSSFKDLESLSKSRLKLMGIFKFTSEKDGTDISCEEDFEELENGETIICSSDDIKYS